MANNKNKNGLNPREQRFADQYLVDPNATEAAKIAGYSAKTAYSLGQRLLNKPEVAAYIEARQKKMQRSTQITAERVIEQAGRMLFSDPRKLMDSAGNPLPLHQLDDATALAVEGVDVETRVGDDGEGMSHVRKYRMASKPTTLDKLMKHLGLFDRDNAQRALAQAGLDDVKAALMKRLKAEGVDPRELVEE